MTGPIRNKPLNMGGQRARGLADGAAADDAVNKGQLDAAITAEEAARDAAIAAANPDIADDRILANISGAEAAASANTLTAILDAIVGTDRGSIVARGETAWAALAPGAAGRFLQSQGAGADLTWGEVGATWRSSVKTADQTRNSSTAWVDVTDLTFAVEAGTYAFDFIVPCTTGAGGLQIGVNGPTASTLYAGIANNSSTIINAYDTSILTVASGNVLARVHGGVTFTASGTFALRIRQNASNAADSTVNAGASLSWAVA
jgi:hypothetical protein